MGNLLTNFEDVKCGVCKCNNSVCKCWQFNADDQTIMCLCKPSNVPMSYKALTWQSNYFIYMCPEKCGAILQKRDLTRFCLLANRNSQVVSTGKILTSNCLTCNKTGHISVVAKQEFSKCDTCSGTGGVKCANHLVKKHQEDVYDFDGFRSKATVLTSCKECGCKTDQGWIKQCNTCRGSGQSCKETIEQKPCTCVNLTCRGFINLNK
jgi:hypothetical protein